MTAWRHTLTWLRANGEEISCSAGSESTAEEIRKLKQLASVTVRRCERELEAMNEPA